VDVSRYGCHFAGSLKYFAFFLSKFIFYVFITANYYSFFPVPILTVALKYLFSQKRFAVIMSFTHAVTLTDDPHLMLNPIKMFCLCSRLVLLPC
jgi:hypothetical protein